MKILAVKMIEQDGVDRRVVAVAGAVDDWAAYIAAWIHSDQWIAQHGLKLTKAEATPLFPLLNPDAYRR